MSHHAVLPLKARPRRVIGEALGELCPVKGAAVSIDEPARYRPVGPHSVVQEPGVVAGRVVTYSEEIDR